MAEGKNAHVNANANADHPPPFNPNLGLPSPATEPASSSPLTDDSLHRAAGKGRIFFSIETDGFAFPLRGGGDARVTGGRGIASRIVCSIGRKSMREQRNKRRKAETGGAITYFPSM